MQARVIGATQFFTEEPANPTDCCPAYDQVRAGNSGDVQGWSGDNMLLLQLRAEIRHGFEQLSAKLLKEIRDSLADSTFPPAASASFPATNPSFAPGSMSCSQKPVTEDLLAGSSERFPIGASSETPTPATRASDDTVVRSSIASAIEKHEMGLKKHFRDIVGNTLRPQQMHNMNTQRFLYRFVHTKAFTAFSMFVILFNALWMGYESDNKGPRKPRPAGARPGGARSGRGRPRGNPLYDSMNLGFSLWFIFELLLKMIALRLDFIFGPDWSWNLLDFVLVAVSIPDMFSNVIINVSIIRMLRLARITRGVRLIRLLKYFVTLREILVTMFYTLGSLFWSFVAIILVAYIFALILSQIIRQSTLAGSTFNPRTDANFLTVWRTMLTLFSLITGGQDWFDTMEDFRNNDAVLAQFFLFCWIYFMMFGFLNVVVAVFCARATEAGQESYELRLAKQQDVQKKKIHDLTGIFHMMDTDNKGFIIWEQFRDFAVDADAQAMLQLHGMELFALQQLWRAMSGYDESRPGEVDVTAFVMGFMRLSGESVNSGFMQLFVEVTGLSSDIRGMFEEQRNYITNAFRSHAVFDITSKQTTV